MKVYVYAISKNESKYVESFVKSMSEADNIYVLDTGSTDDTVEKLRSLGVVVKEEKIEPFRFDIARNKSLAMVPSDADICVCVDFDEEFNKGWRSALESVWKKENPTRVDYLYNWSFDLDGNPATTFYISKIHKRNAYAWYHPVHEVLVSLMKEEKSVIADNVILNHHQDLEKSRGSYLPLLELSVKEDPQDDRNMHYLGREYMYYKRWNDAIDTLIKHLKLKTSTWKVERCASMRFIARSYLGLERLDEAIMWLKKAIVECPYVREAYVELARVYYSLENYEESYKYLTKALEIEDKPKIYINESFCWNYEIYDLMSIVCYNLEKYEESLKYIEIAYSLNNTSERIKKNLELIKEKNSEV